jgi:formylglycine-generating enzyme required for sulfatase activity
MAQFPVTQKLYQEVMGESPSYFKGESLPSRGVSWFDAVRFCNKLSWFDCALASSCNQRRRKPRERAQARRSRK